LKNEDKKMNSNEESNEAEEESEIPEPFSEKLAPALEEFTSALEKIETFIEGIPYLEKELADLFHELNNIIEETTSLKVDDSKDWTQLSSCFDDCGESLESLLEDEEGFVPFVADGMEDEESRELFEDFLRKGDVLFEQLTKKGYYLAAVLQQTT